MSFCAPKQCCGGWKTQLNPRNKNTNMQRQQGVLWKRRDVFQNRWRPRWFVLHPTQGVLTYYLLNNNTATTTANHDNNINNLSFDTPRARTTSWDSTASQQSMDYDVVPRGTIDLGEGTAVYANAALSKPDFFVLTIESAGQQQVHLAARSAQTRSLWIRRLTIVCNTANNTEMSQTSLPLLRDEPSVTPTSLSDEAASGNITPPWSNQNDNNNCDSAVMENNESASSYSNLDPALVDEIRVKLATYRALCSTRDDGPPRGHGWKALFDRTVLQHPHKAYRRQEASGCTLICSTAILPHSPVQVLTLLLDYTHRPDYETNIRTIERMKICNPNTFMDYYAYNAVWPTQAREFTIVSHWQQMDNDTLVAVSFSHPTAAALKAVAPHHVRGQLHVSLYVLRSLHTGCHLTRFLSFDLLGGVSQKLSNVILTQQASLPAVLAEYLHKQQPRRSVRSRSTTDMERQVRESLQQTLNDSSVQRQLSFLEHESFRDDDESDDSNTLAPVSLELQAMILLGPLGVYIAMKGTIPSYPCLGVFLVLAFLAVRQVFLLHIVGETLVHNSDDAPLVGPVTCRFTVELKGILRYVQNKREEREELAQETGQEDITVVHLVSSAVAKAWAREKELRVQRVYYPWLLIDELVDVSSQPVDVSISENASGVVTIENVDRRSVQSVADEVAAAEAKTECPHKLGQCLVLATRDAYSAVGSSDGTVVETDVVAYPETVAVVAVVNGVDRRNRGSLSVSLTITLPHLTDVVGCKHFTEEVRKLLTFPEMCDG